MPLAPGTRIGPYEVRALLGAGGMGEVYRAHDAKLARDVAVKVLPGELIKNPVALERFEREARAVAALSHPNILAIYDFGTDGDRVYAAMELLEGRTLRERLADGPLPVNKTVEIAGQVARGLGAAHEKGIVHRDLKPENVFVTTSGQAKVLDFGLASSRAPAGSSEATNELPTRTSLTQPGAVMGTVPYLSPEQVRSQEADHRSDIFSFGSMLHEMLHGCRAFDRETAAETMTAILREEPAEPAEASAETMPPSLLRVVRRCLEKQPDERFQSANDLAFALDNSVQISGLHTPPPVAPSTRGSRRGTVGLLVSLALLIGLALGFLLRGGGTGEGTTEPVRVRRITVSGSDRDPSTSPDGRMVAFASSRDGVPRVWIKQLAGGGEEPLTDGPDSYPSFSPDGSTVLFLRDEGSRMSIYRQALVGQQARKLVDDAQDLAWSPDGTRIAFLRYRTEAGRRTSEFGVADAQEGGGQTLLEVERALYGLSWSPDGRRLLAVETAATGNAVDYALRFVDPDSGETERHVLTGQSGPISPPLWVGNDELIMARAGSVIGDQGDPLSRVVRHDLGSGDESTLFWAANLFPTQGLRIDFARFGVVSEGTLIFHQTDVREHLRIAELGRTETESIRSRELTRGEGRDRQPVFSPDGGRVLFSSNRSGNLDLWSMDLQDGSLIQVTDDPAQDWDPAFTPDGTGIVWSSDRIGHLELWTADTDGSRARQLTQDGADAENPTVTADGQWVVYWSANPDKSGVWKIRIDGSEATRLVEGPFMQPEVSPDGRYAAFVSIEIDTLNNIVRVVDVETGELLPFSIDVPAPLRAPGIILGRTRWLPDGSALAWVGFDEKNRTGIYAQDFDPAGGTDGTRRAVAGFSPDFITESFGISPDGKRIVIAGIRRSFRLMLADGVPGVVR